MGICSSSNISPISSFSSYKPPFKNNIIPENSTKWKIIATKPSLESKDFIKYSTQDEIEFRIILDEPIGQKYIGNYAKKTFTTESFFCWVELKEFNSIPSQGFRKYMAFHIYQKYIKPGAAMALGCLPDELVKDMEKKLQKASEDEDFITEFFFSEVCKLGFQDMMQNIFLRFKLSHEYELYKEEIKNTYNRVTTDDFDYMGIIGYGGFGRVVHVRKKSTSKHYAMKIQLKTSLLREYNQDLSQISSEKRIFQLCNHPYIVEMDYSFQTIGHAIIVLGLVRAGDLRQVQVNAVNGRLSEERVRIYAAEIVLALHHLHEKGLIYRDLKPCNVLLGEDGHIKLADMGLAAGLDIPLDGDPSTDLMLLNSNLIPISSNLHASLSQQLIQNQNLLKAGVPKVNKKSTEEQQQVRNEYHQDESEENSIYNNGNMKNDNVTALKDFQRPPLVINVRRKTTVGTKGYMAPEMLADGLQKRSERKGYNHSVDFWALGVTMYELLCGKQPFLPEKKASNEDNDDMFYELALEYTAKKSRKDDKKKTENELKTTMEELVLPSYLSSGVKDLIRKLLDFNAETRIGCSLSNGILDILQHPFFDEIDWGKLLVKHITPSYIPDCSLLNDKPEFDSFDDMMAVFDFNGSRLKNNWQTLPTPQQQIYFQDWDYISPRTLKVELGIASEMDESNKPFKAMQLLGSI